MRVRHHTLLQSQGGAARVARLLMAHADHAVGHGYELDDAGRDALYPDQAARYSDHADILHVHGTRSWEGLLRALPADLPLVITLHDASLVTGGCPYVLDCPHYRACAHPCPRGFPDAAQRQAARLRLVHEKAPLLVSPSAWLKRHVLGLLPEAKVKVVPNGAPWPVSTPDKGAARAALGVPAGARVAAFAAHGGEKAAYKAGDRWQGLWEAISAGMPDSLALFVGGAEASRDGNIFRLPYVDAERLNLVFAAADVFCYPTLADNHPLVVLEAAAQATTTVAFAVGGTPETMAPGLTGLLVRPGDWEGFATTCAGLLAEPRRARALGREAFQQGGERFSAVRMAADYARLYARLMPS